MRRSVGGYVSRVYGSDSARTPFGHWLRRQRKALDLTQEQVAQGVGCSSKTIEKIEGGTRRPSRQVAELLATFFSIPADEQASFVTFARSQTSGVAAALSTESYLPASSETDPSARSQEPLLSVPPGNLPASPNAFIGRQQEKDRGRFYLRRHGVRLLTLTGPPGIGKSRLALELASSLANDFEGGTYLVRLAPINDHNMLASAIAGVLGVSESSREPPMRTVIRSLHGKRTLILLDNFEHLMGATAVVTELLASCPLLKLLVTSRQPTHVYGEHELQVPPLAVPPGLTELEETGEHIQRRTYTDARPEEVHALLEYESIQLFTERALAVKPDFAVTPDNARLITEVCALLEGFPLAIELASAMTKTLPLSALLARLSGSVIDMVAQTANVPERQQSMGRAIGWSYRLLQPDEQALFRCVSVFAGSFDVQSAAALAPGEDRVRETLDALADKSMVQAHVDDRGYARYRLLGALKEYGLAQLAAHGESDLVQKRCSTYFLELAESSEDGLRGPEQAMWLARLDAEHPNLRAALDWFCSGSPARVEQGVQMAGAMQRFWFMRRYYSEAIQQLTRVLALPGAHRSDPFEARACLGLGFFLVERGDLTEASVLYEQALGIYRERDDLNGIATALHRLGAVANIKGDHAQARAACQQSLRLYEQLGDKWRSAVLLIALGRLAQHIGEYGESRDLYAQSVAIFRELGDKRQVAAGLTGLSTSMLELGQMGEARLMLQEALDICSEMAGEGNMVSVLTGLGELERCLGNYTRAYSYYEQALSIAEKQDNKIRMVPPLHGMAYSTLRLATSRQHRAEVGADEKQQEGKAGIDRTGIEQRKEALSKSEQNKSGELVDDSVSGLGKARTLFEEALRIAIEAEFMRHVPTSLAGLADLLACEGDFEGSATLIGLAERLMGDYDMQLEIADRSAYQEMLDLIRARLGAERFSIVCERGRAMPLGELVLYPQLDRVGDLQRKEENREQAPI
jgi:predicted ATPase/transcriptional regulator with XRE-family HTH domain